MKYWSFWIRFYLGSGRWSLYFDWERKLSQFVGISRNLMLENVEDFWRNRCKSESGVVYVWVWELHKKYFLLFNVPHIVILSKSCIYCLKMKVSNLQIYGERYPWCKARRWADAELSIYRGQAEKLHHLTDCLNPYKLW